MATRSSVATLSDELRRRLDEALLGFGPGARAQFLRVLKMGSEARARLIAELYQSAKTRLLAELLIDLEEDDFVRAAVEEALERMKASSQ